jgi:hypothetical protein
MAVLCLDPLQQYLDDAGDPLNGGFLYTYDAITGDPRAVYTETTGVTPHENPIELDSNGRPPSPIFYTQGAGYNLVLKTAEGVTIQSNISFEVPEFSGDPASGYLDVVFFKGGTPSAGELIYAEVLAHDVTFAANFAGSYGLSPTLPPDAEWVVTIKLNGSTIGTATCSTLGTWTFATSGAAVVNALTGDEIKYVSAAGVTTIEDVGLTTVGTLA